MFGLLREPRILFGIVLMLIATVIGGVVMQRASARIAVWQVDHALAAGTPIAADDLHVAEVAGSLSAYVPATTAVVGKLLQQPLRAGELLPQSALTAGTEQLDEVMVPATALHMPDGLRHGELVDVWVTTTEPLQTRRVLMAVRVVRAISADVGGGRGVALAVPPAKTAVLVAALRAGELDLVRVTR